MTLPIFFQNFSDCYVFENILLLSTGSPYHTIPYHTSVRAYADKAGLTMSEVCGPSSEWLNGDDEIHKSASASTLNKKQHESVAKVCKLFISKVDTI